MVDREEFLNAPYSALIIVDRFSEISETHNAIQKPHERHGVKDGQNEGLWKSLILTFNVFRARVVE